MAVKKTNPLAFAACAALAIVAAATFRPHYELQAVTVNGALYIAGSGDTCKEAWQGAVLPANWERLSCVKSYL